MTFNPKFDRIAFALVALPVAASVLAPTALAATELAKINKTVITLEDFNKKYSENMKYFQMRTPSKKSVLDDLVKRELGIQEAKKLGLDKDPEIIDRMNTVLYHALLDKKLAKEFEGIAVSDDEAKKYYQTNPEIRTSHLFVPLQPNAGAEQQKKANEDIHRLQAHVKDGKMSFAEIAQRWSQGPAAPMGGDVDYQTRDKLDPAYYEAAFKLKTAGKVSDVVRSQYGLHIIKLTAIRPWEESDKAAVKRLVFEEKRGEIFQGFMTKLRNQAKVSVKSELLKD